MKQREVRQEEMMRVSFWEKVKRRGRYLAPCPWSGGLGGKSGTKDITRPLVHEISREGLQNRLADTGSLPVIQKVEDKKAGKGEFRKGLDQGGKEKNKKKKMTLFQGGAENFYLPEGISQRGGGNPPER